MIRAGCLQLPRFSLVTMIRADEASVIATAACVSAKLISSVSNPAQTPLRTRAAFRLAHRTRRTQLHQVLSVGVVEFISKTE